MVWITPYHRQSSIRRRRIILQLHQAAEHGLEMQEEFGPADAEMPATGNEPDFQKQLSGESDSVSVPAMAPGNADVPILPPQIEETGTPFPSQHVSSSQVSTSEAAAETGEAQTHEPAKPSVTYIRKKSTPKLEPVPSTVPGLLRYLKSTPQVNWLLTGESLPIGGGPKNTGSVPENLMVSSLSAYLRDVVGRGDDTVRSTETPHFHLQDLVRGFDKKIGGYSPQIVVITCGLTELQTRWESPVAFEHMFHKLVLRIRNAGAVPIIATPPWPCPSDSFHHTDELIRLEAIRACAEESAALLVDHWEHWENCSDNEWYSADRQMLSERGVQEIVAEFAKTLKLNQLAELKV